MKCFVRKKRRILLTLSVMAAVTAAYVALLIFPDAFFAHTFRRGLIVIRSDEPIPRSAAAVLDHAVRRLADSPLNRPQVERRVYVCNKGWRFILFVNIRYNAGGLTYALLTNNVFLRRSDFDNNRLIGPSGNKVPGERTLSYFIAHELAHTLIADRLGTIGYWRLPTWKDEGYSDYLAKGSDFRMEDTIRKLKRGQTELDPLRSGLYLRYHLLVAHLLHDKGVSVSKLFETDFDVSELERELRSSNASSR
jgi:hypothetical protein